MHYSVALACLAVANDLVLALPQVIGLPSLPLTSVVSLPTIGVSESLGVSVSESLGVSIGGSGSSSGNPTSAVSHSTVSASHSTVSSSHPTTSVSHSTVSVSHSTVSASHSTVSVSGSKTSTKSSTKSSSKSSTSSTTRPTFSFTKISSSSSVTKTSSSAVHTCTNFNANFDNLPVIFPTGDLGSYDNLNYIGLQVYDIGVAGIDTVGLLTSSSPNAIAFVQTAGKEHRLAIPVGSSVKHFDFERFYFGCVLNPILESVASVPTNCTIQVVGKKAGKVIGTQSFSFTPTNLVQSSLKHALVEDQFDVVDEVDFSILSGSPSASAVAVVMDNLVYRTCPY